MAWNLGAWWTLLLSLYVRSSETTRAALPANSEFGDKETRSVEAQGRESAVDKTSVAIYAMITCFLERCGLYYPEGNIDHDFITKCRQEAIHRGYIMEGPTSLDRWILPSAIMAM
jgi:hypothetical protein